MAKLVYIAGPLFSEAERAFLEQIVNTLAASADLNPLADFFLPHRDGAELGKKSTRREIFDMDLNNLTSASIVVALLDGQDVDSGTCIELGYAYAKGKKIFGILTDFRSYYTSDAEPHRPNLMVWGSCEKGATLFHNVTDLANSFSKYVNFSLNMSPQLSGGKALRNS